MINYIGLDFEATGSDPWGRHVPIQVGMAHGAATFESLIGGWQFDNYNDPANSWEWSETAFGIHGITREDLAKAPPVWAVDIRAAAWVLDRVGHTNRMFNVTVGWNVAGYDRQFVTRWMPSLSRLLSYRTLDLNALVFAASESEGDYERHKKAAKAAADRALGGGDPDRHDALYDARCAVQELHYLRSLLEGFME